MKSDIEKCEILLRGEQEWCGHDPMSSTEPCKECPIGYPALIGCAVKKAVRHAAARKKLDELRAKEKIMLKTHKQYQGEIMSNRPPALRPSSNGAGDTGYVYKKEEPRPQTLKDLLTGKTLPFKITRVGWLAKQWFEIVSINEKGVVGFNELENPMAWYFDDTYLWLPYTPKLEPMRIESNVIWVRVSGGICPVGIGVDFSKVVGKKGKLIFQEEL
jgi:hypothetical protein